MLKSLATSCLLKKFQELLRIFFYFEKKRGFVKAAMYRRDNLRSIFLKYGKNIILIISAVQVTVFNLDSTAILCTKVYVDINRTFTNVSTWLKNFSHPSPRWS